MMEAYLLSPSSSIQEGSNEQKSSSVFQQAMEGRLKPDNFKSVIREWIRDQNGLAKKGTECTLSKHMLDFVKENEQCPVVDFDSDRMQEDTLVISNPGKSKYYFEVVLEDNPKFDIKPSLEVGELKKGKSVDIVFKIRVFCTTLTYQMAKIVLYEKKLPTSRSKYGSVAKKKDRPTEVASLYFSFKIESELSKSIDHDELEYGKRVGIGAFGTVYVGKWRGAEVAIKRIQDVEDMVDEELAGVRREVALLNKLAYAHIVTYMGATQIKGQPFCIVMEYIRAGSLSNLLKKPLSDRFKCKLSLDVAKGMNYLHAHKIFHRDIKPDNVLVVSDQEGPNVINLKITDFGTARIARSVAARLNDPYYLKVEPKVKDSKKEEKKEDQKAPKKDSSPNLTTAVGTLLYNAPEIIAGDPSYAIDKTDVFSFGVLLLQTFTQKTPFSEPPYSSWGKWEIQDFIKEGRRLEIPKSVPRQIRSLVERCWAQEQNSRPDFSAIVQELENLYHNYLKSDGGESEESSPEPNRRKSKSKHVKDKSKKKEKKEKSGLVYDNGIPVPRATIRELLSIGWFSDISRPDAEVKLTGAPEGCFMLRYSSRTKSYVLSYVNGGQVQHIGYIEPQKNGSISVFQEDKGIATYEDIFEYINAMKENDLIREPLSLVSSEPDLYQRSPASRK